MKEPSRYAKALVSILAAVLVALTTALTDSVVDSLDWVTIGIAFVTAVSVYLVPNLDGNVSRYAKTIVAFSGAALASLAAILINGGDVNLSSWLTIVVAGLGALGVAIVPNNTTTEVPEIDDSQPVENVEYVF